MKICVGLTFSTPEVMLGHTDALAHISHKEWHISNDLTIHMDTDTRPSSIVTIL